MKQQKLNNLNKLLNYMAVIQQQQDHEQQIVQEQQNIQDFVELVKDSNDV
eukprot:UN00528